MRLRWASLLALLWVACRPAEPIARPLEPSPAKAPPAPDRAPLPASEQPFELERAGLRLVGVVDTPRRTPGELAPGVVLGHGSGPVSRDGTMTGQLGMSFGFPIPVLQQLGHGLRDAGFFVARYDKRSCGDFNGCSRNDYPKPEADIVIDDFLLDAEAAIRSLRGVEGVDPDRIYYVGHSQSACFAPILLPEVRAAVMIAPPHGSPAAEIALQVAQLREIGLKTGKAAEVLEHELAPLSGAVTQLEELDRRGPQGATILGAIDRFWWSWSQLQARSRESAGRAQRPLLVLFGDYDWNVPPMEAESWKKTLGASQVSHDFALLPCVTHALNCVSQPDFTKVQPDDIARHVAPEVIETIARFLSSH